MKELKIRKRRTKYFCAGVLTLLILCACGCGRTQADEKSETGNETVTEAATETVIETATIIETKPEQPDSSESESENQSPTLLEVMDRILSNQGLDKAEDYESGIEDVLTDKLILLCRSENETYEAYGFISPEYGKKGILINHIIDGEDNWNYFEESWAYGSVRPTLEETGEYEVLFTFTQENVDEDTRKIYFDTYDTGTMSVRE